MNPPRNSKKNFCSFFSLKLHFSRVLGLTLLHGAVFAQTPDAHPDIQQAEDKITLFAAQKKGLAILDKSKDAYTINFNNVAMVEYIRFASKITNLNFIFNEDELKFNVSIVSEEPVTASNVISILIQVLRINGLVVLEQENNLLITRVRNVSQLATVVDSDLPSQEGKPRLAMPLVTRVFRIKNGNLNTIATVIKPMLSDSALLETSSETKQLIITDITTNVEKISSLLSALDAPHSLLEIDTYVAKHVELQELIQMATQIVTPFAEGNSLLFVPQAESSTIFIVSTPYLIERAMAVLEDLDSGALERKSLTAQGLTVFLYPLQHKTGEDFLHSLEDLSEQLIKQAASQKLINCLTKARWIKKSNSILFLADNDTLGKVKELLPTLDTTVSNLSLPAPKSGLLVYKIEFADPEHLQNSLDEVTVDLQKASQPDYNLIDALTSVKFIPEAYSLIFTGESAALDKLKELLAVFDITTPPSHIPQFLVFNPKNRSGEELKKSLEEITHNLKSAGYSDLMLSQAVESAKWTPAINSLIFTGHAETLARIQAMLSSLDEGKEGFEGPYTFYVYKLKNAPGQTVLDNLHRIASNLTESHIGNLALMNTLKQAKWIKENNSILLTGNTAALDQAKLLIEQFDTATVPLVFGNKSAFFIYKPTHQTPAQLQSALKDLQKSFHASGLVDSDLLSTIETMQYVASTNSILFTGTTDSLEKIKALVRQIDAVSSAEAHFQQLGEYTFFIYKVQYVPASQLILSLKGFASDLEKNSAITPEEAASINNVKWIKETNSLVFTGSEQILQKIELLIKKFDVPELAPKAGDQIFSNFVIYTPRNQPGDELIKILEEFEEQLVSAGVSNKSLFNTIATLKWIPRTHSLIISGDPDSVARVEDLLKRFDVPLAGAADQSIGSIQNTSFLIYKLQYHQGNEILSALKQVATELTPAAVAGSQSFARTINSLQWIRVTNSLLASGDAETLSKLRDLIQNLDVPLRQVFIEVLVIETELTNTQNFGLQWGGKMQYLNKFAAGTGNFPPPIPGSPSQTFNPSTAGTTLFQKGISAPPPLTSNIPFVNGFDLGVIGDIIMHKGRSFISLGSLVNALQTDIDSTIILNPKIIAQDNQTSTIFVGDNIPYIGSLVTTDSTLLSSSSNIEYRDIGFNLTITPTIGSNDVITLSISNDISEVVNNTNTIGSVSANNQANTITGIQTSHTSMSTRVNVPNENFVVLSGMIRDSKARFKSGLPCLGGLPVIGALFSENDRINSKHNIIIFMRPRIINTYAEYQEVTASQEKLFKNQAILPVLKEEFDAAIDIVKQPEDEPSALSDASFEAQEIPKKSSKKKKKNAKVKNK